jgi:hypothetical protein
MTALDWMAVIFVAGIVVWFVRTLWRLGGKNDLERLAEAQRDLDDLKSKIFD